MPSALLRDDYDSAAAAFEQAYKKDPKNKEAIFYSTLGRLASISIDAKVRKILQSIGFNNYPGNLNNLFTLGDSWENYYTDESYTETAQRPLWLKDFSGKRLPDYRYPSGYYAFQNQQTITQESKIDGLESMATYMMVMFFNAMGSNIQDMNYVVDEILEYVFGDAFETAAARATTFNYGDTITLDSGINKKLFMTKYLQDGDHVGRAELDLVFSSLWFCKALLEWLSSYDLETDRYMFRLWSFNAQHFGTFFPPIPGLFDALNKPFVSPDKLNNDGTTSTDLLNRVVGFFLGEMDKYYSIHQSEIPRIPGMMPLRNHFLKERSDAQKAINRAKNSLLKAIEPLSNVYNYYYNPESPVPQLIQNEVLPGFKWLDGGFSALQNAIRSGSIFYFPGEMPKGAESWNYTASNARFGVNTEKLFTPGQLSLDRLFVTESGGRLPKFYGWKANTEGAGQYISRREEIANYEWIGFMFNLGPLKEVFVQGLEKNGRSLQDNECVHTLFPDILFTRTNGEYLYMFYHDLYNYTLKWK